MNKADLKEIIKRTEHLNDEIELYMVDYENVPVEIKHVDYIINEIGEGMLVIVPMGAHTWQKTVRIWPRD